MAYGGPRPSARLRVFLRWPEPGGAGSLSGFLEAAAAYRTRRLPLSAPLALPRSGTIRFDEPYLRQQAFLHPFPEERTSLEDSGRGKGWV
ncbi:MAG: DUF1722 domain-containing protein [Thermoflexus sp.]|nr:DUF1722 domain-containing protein [Thermoflexus sp.]